MSETIKDFLHARIAEDEGTAEWVAVSFPDGEVVPLSSRVLAECAAKRELVDGWHDEHGGGHVLKTLASVYSDHPDYRPEWSL